MRKRVGVTKSVRFFIGSLCILGIVTIINNVEYSGSRRYLVNDLGEGKCVWSAPIDDTNITNPGEVERTLIVGFPGVGKRLVWGLVEQLTNRRIGDDWNLGNLGDNVVALKTSYPHPAGNWFTAMNEMYQTVMVIRNPMTTFIDYHNMKKETYPAHNVEEMKQLHKVDQVFKEEAPVDSWYIWRDAAFDRQMDLYGWFIEFYMDNGRRRNNGDGRVYYDSRCTETMVGTCIPKAIIQYEALLDPSLGEGETAKLANVLVNRTGVPLVNESVWDCAYQEVMKKSSFYSLDKRPSSGNEKTYSYKQLGIMRRELDRLIEKYEAPIYHDVPAANQLIEILTDYLININLAFETAWNIHQEENF